MVQFLPNLEKIWITFYLTQYVELAGQGKVFTAPLDVELAPNQIVQPDVFILLQASLAKLTTKRVIGAPDLVVEVSSPATAVSAIQSISINQFFI